MNKNIIKNLFQLFTPYLICICLISMIFHLHNKVNSKKTTTVLETKKIDDVCFIKYKSI